MAYQVVTPVKLGQAAMPIAVGVLYTVPALTRTFLKDLDICNTTANILSATVYLVPGGGTPGAGNMLLPSVPIQPASVGGMFQWSGTQILNAGDTIQIVATGPGLTINASGGEAV